jgi:YggT family protein
MTQMSDIVQQLSSIPFAIHDSAQYLLISSTSETVSNAAIIATARPVLDIFISTLSFLFICRTVLSWYPKTDLNKFPYNIISWPTEPLLQPARQIIPPAFGVDVTSLVWIMILSFFREILTGQQGILTLLEKSM